MVSIETIGEQFAEMGIEPAPAILGRCLDLCTTYRIDDPVEFVEQWMAFSVSHLGGAEPTLDNLADLERRELDTKKTPAAPAAAAAAAASRSSVASRGHAFESSIGGSGARVFGGRGATTTNDDDDGSDDFMDSYITRTPKANHRHQSRLQQQSATDSPSQSQQACASPLGAGKAVHSYVAGQAVCTFGNAALVKRTEWTAPVADAARTLAITVRHHQPANALAADDKYMFDTLHEKSLTAADRLYDIGHQICVKLQTDRDAARAAEAADIAEDDGSNEESKSLSVFEQLVHPDVACQQPVLCCGRIYCDAEAPLGAGSTWLCSTDDRRMRSVRLNLTRVRSCALFAGQSVVVRGTNPRGDTLYVDEVACERQLARAPAPLVAVEALSVLMASGPFTMDADLAYEPLHDVLAYARDQRPDVLVLMGPFVEAEHRMVVGGELLQTYEEFFAAIVAEVMSKMGPDTQVIIVASAADVNSSAAYPTHPLAVRGAQWTNLTLVGDPAMLQIGGVLFGITTTDVLQHLLEGELAHNAGERIKRSVSHLFHQASFYPLDPPQLDVGVDSELAARCAQLRTVPNVLLVPSAQLKCFVRDIGGCLVLNPGRLCDGKARGTFARLVVHRPERAATADEGAEVPLSSYVACQVVKM